MIDLVVFDLDGTLVDSRTDLARATNALVAELGGEPLPEDSVAGMVGEGAGVLVRRALAAAALDPTTPGALERFLALYDERLLDTTRAYPGVRETLEALAAERPLAVLTNKPSDPTGRILSALGLAPYFRAVVGGDSPHGRKPDPAGLRHLADAAGAGLAQTLLVGDSAIDLETARRAGARICLCRYGFGYRFAGGAFRGDEWFIDQPQDLLVLVTSMTPPPPCYRPPTI
jgi:phosphoglycolate phosphatase